LLALQPSLHPEQRRLLALQPSLHLEQPRLLLVRPPFYLEQPRLLLVQSSLHLEQPRLLLVRPRFHFEQPRLSGSLGGQSRASRVVNAVRRGSPAVVRRRLVTGRLELLLEQRDHVGGGRAIAERLERVHEHSQLV